jgi:predicted exporter
MEQQAQAVAWLNSQKQRFTNEQTNHKLIHSGALFHSQQAAQNAKKEIAIISSISIIAIVLLFWLAFKSITPLLLGIGSLAFAFIASCIVSFSVFQSVHVITLVFGASLIGVSIDYCLHMLCENQYHPDQKNSLQKIFPALVVGLISSCIGYGILAQSSLVSLQQIAVFSVTGLFSAWLFVVVFISRFRAKAVNNSYLLNAASIAERFWQQLGQRQSLFVLIALFVSSTIIVAFTANPLNSIRSLYQAEDAILQQDKIVSGWLKNISANQFFIISANNNDALLEQELNLTNKLDALIEEQKLSNYKALSQFLASSSEQKNNYQLLQQQVYSDQGLAARFYQKINASSAMLEQSRADFQQSEHLLLTVEALQAVLPKALQNLYLGEINGKVYSLVLLQGIKELTPLEQLTNNDIRFIDNVALISSSLQNQQQHALQQLLLAYALIALLLLLRFRQISSIALLGPAFLSSLLSIAVICLLGLPITLFHIFALFLCLGLGLDYAIFLFEGKLRPSTMIAVFLSALTSLLSFGLLSLSSTAMISAFGLCILLGSLANFLLAPGFILLIKGHQE